MATSLSRASLWTNKQSTGEPCSHCKRPTGDISCACGERFHFACIQHHVNDIGRQAKECHRQVEDRLAQIKGLNQNGRTDVQAARASIEDWRRKRLQEVNEIADQALHEHAQQGTTPFDVATFQETYDQVSSNMEHVGHSELDQLVELKRQLQETLETTSKPSSANIDEASLDTLLQAKLNRRGEEIRPASATSAPVERRDDLDNLFDGSTRRLPSVPSTKAYPPPILTNSDTHSATGRTVLPSTATGIEVDSVFQNSYKPNGLSSVPAEPPRAYSQFPPSTTPKSHSASLTNGTDAHGAHGGCCEPDAGLAQSIQRHDATVINAGPDRFSGTIASHQNQLLYNSFDDSTKNWQLTFIPDINDPSVLRKISWDTPDTVVEQNDNDWIQDISYCDDLAGYLILNRARLRVYRVATDKLDEFRTFPERTMKRVACCENLIYLVAVQPDSNYAGDTLLVTDTQGAREASKPFRELMPAQITRGSGPIAGEISDIAVAQNERAAVGYRLARRREVGVCIFVMKNRAIDWSLERRLVLDDCWHADLSYTPRMDWCEKLQVFTLVECKTARLLMIDGSGHVKGESCFGQATDRQGSPMNLTVSSNNWLCVRYEHSLVVHRITG